LQVKNKIVQPTFIDILGYQPMMNLLKLVKIWGLRGSCKILREKRA